MKLIAQNFLGLERVAWEPRDVSLVVGPNGSGKTSLLQAFLFLQFALMRSVPAAVDYIGGPRGLRRLGAPADQPVVLGVGVGDLRWEIELSVSGGTVAELPGERVYIGDEIVLHRAPFSREWSLGSERIADKLGERRTCLYMAWDRAMDPRLNPLARAIADLAVYGEKWSVPRLWEPVGASTLDNRVLSFHGGNLFNVLANWRSAPRQYRGQYDWVRSAAKDAFYDIFDDLEIETVGDTIVPRFFAPGGAEGLPMRRAADGLIVGLLHLTAVAGAPEGALVAIDEMENQLHPHAIRVILRAMRERAEEHDLTIVLTTHSPVLMDGFAGHLDNFYVTEPGRPVTPVPLPELHDPRYLAQFALGDLYERLKFGAPRAPG